MTWDRRSIPQAGISVAVYKDWPLEVYADSISQPAGASGGAVFVRWGAGAGLEDFVSGQSDLVTRASVVQQGPVLCGGIAAREVRLVAVRQAMGVYREELGRGILHGTEPPGRTEIRAIGFENHQVPVLIGYRLPDDSPEEYRSIMDRILNTVKLTE